VHLGALGLVLAAPSSSREPPPRVISVELVAPPSAAAKPAPAPAPSAKPAPPKPPPPPKPKQTVLPENPTQSKPKAKPEPKPEPKAETRPPEKEIFKEPEKKQEKSLEELMAELRGDSSDAPPTAEPVETAKSQSPSPGASQGTGDTLSPEERDWHARVIRKMKGIWVVPPGFRTQPLETHVMVRLDAAGNILGEPRITRRSGNPWFDEGVIIGLTKANPLPAPPEAGEWPMVFEPGDSL
jgi:colicin import membrane protein